MNYRDIFSYSDIPNKPYLLKNRHCLHKICNKIVENYSFFIIGTILKDGDNIINMN